MIVAIDESGDPGFKFQRGSSRYFCMVAVCFENREKAVVTSKEMEKLKISLRRKQSYEFKYHKVRPVTKEKFFALASKFKFEARAIYVDKTKIDSFKNNAEAFYNVILLKLLESIEGSELKITLDGEAGRKHAKETRTFLRKNMRRGKIRSFSYNDSKNDNLVQLADMIAGVVMQELCDEMDAKKYLKKINRNLKIEKGF